MSKPRSRRRREMLEVSAPPVATVPASIDPDETVDPNRTPSASTPSYIRELADAESQEALTPVPTPEQATEPEVVTAAAAEPHTDRADADEPADDESPPADDPSAMLVSSPPANDAESLAPPSSLPPSSPVTYEHSSIDDDDGVAALERHLATGWTPSPRLRRNALVVAGVAAVFAIGSSAFHRSSHVHPRAIATHTTIAAAAHSEPAPAVIPPTPIPAAVVPTPAPAAPEPTTAAAALESDAVAPQPTEQLEQLLDTARRARMQSVREATSAMQAWLDAGGNDAQPVAQFAYWLGRNGNVQLAEQWAERATTMDPQSQMAWYVLGATRLEDPRQRRADTFDALRRCAALPGVFTAECRGPLRY